MTDCFLEKLYCPLLDHWQNQTSTLPWAQGCFKLPCLSEKVDFHIREANIAQKLSSYPTFAQLTYVDNCCGDCAAAEVWNVECTKKANILAGRTYKKHLCALFWRSWWNKRFVEKTLVNELTIWARPVVSVEVHAPQMSTQVKQFEPEHKRSVAAQESSSRKPQRHIWVSSCNSNANMWKWENKRGNTSALSTQNLCLWAEKVS